MRVAQQVCNVLTASLYGPGMETFVGLLGVILCLGFSCTWGNAQDRCTGGIADAAGIFCCPLTCGQCGGLGCDMRPGGGSQCCGTSIKDTCSTFAGPPPCRYTLHWAPPLDRCSAGVPDLSGRFCCPKACGQCGGLGCEMRPGGGSQCCGGSIESTCNTSAGFPPCKYPPEWTPPPARCSAGIVDVSGRFCCPKACGQCGGLGCDMRPGGGSQCCGGSINAACHTSAGPPPCAYSHEVASPPQAFLSDTPSLDRCHDGIVDSRGIFCCPSTCGECGGLGCDMRPGGGSQCCGSSMKVTCSSAAGPPPCRYPLGWTPPPVRCTAGIADSTGSFCCPKACGQCGGLGCDMRPGGGPQCCGGSIKETCATSVGEPPCFYPALRRHGEL